MNSIKSFIRFSTYTICLVLAYLICILNPACSYADNQLDDSVPVYRMWHPWTGEHFFTANRSEVDSLEASTPWINEGIGFKSPKEGQPIYRIYNPWSGEHFYTNNENEQKSLVRVGWNDEGIGFYSSIEKTPFQVYRLYNSYQEGSSHLWTIDHSEYSGLADLGWIQEGSAWFTTGGSEFLPEDQRKPIQPQYSEEDLFSMKWAPRIDNYNYGWPLYGYGDAFARAAYRNGMDPRTAPAIARIESGSGKAPLYRYGAGNCWGWMSMLTNDFESSIYLYCEKFSRSYGSTLTYSGCIRYAGYGGYYYVLQREMNKI